MYRKTPVIRTKLTPPRLNRRILPRPRLTARLLEALDYRLTIVQAGMGYGKSTALAALAGSGHPLVWYHLGVEDADPLIFLLHLLQGFHTVFPNLTQAPLVVLEDLESGADLPWAAFVDLLISELAETLSTPTLLVLDDVHILRDTPQLLAILDRFIQHAPATLHVILSSRYPLPLPSLLSWQVRGEVLEIGQAELAFTAEEIATLFQEQYGLALRPAEATALAAETEGWPIAVQLVWQRLRSGAVAAVPEALDRLPGSADQLFAYLAQEILAQQPADIRQFLVETSVLQEMTATLCDCVRQANDSATVLHTLLDNNLFVVDLGGGYLRYHHLFREFLYQQQRPHERRAAHYRAAVCCRQQENPEEALYHLLAAAAYEDAAAELERLAPDLVRAGRLDTLGSWLEALPPALLDAHPRLLTYLGDIARLRSRFDEALGWYRQAEQRARLLGDQGGAGLALRGQARVYLDTVNPSQAESVLQEALRLSDGQEDRESRARLLELMAENRLNSGRPEEARQLQAQAQALREEGPSEADLSVRVMLRTGQLEQARSLLEKRLEVEQQVPVWRPRAHRETLLLLSLIIAFQGEAELAHRYAIEGTERGRALQSPFVTAVGYMRQGHAWLLRGLPEGYEEACRCYRETIKLGDTLAVPRLKVEAYWGLCRAHGFHGALDAAEQAAEQGLALAEAAGDTWIAALIRLSLGAAYTLAHRSPQAAERLARAWTDFYGCGDVYGQTVTRLWQALLWLESDDRDRLERAFDDFQRLTAEYHYDFLFTRRTLQGPPDPRRLVPLLIYARNTGKHRAYAESLLAQLGLSGVEFHPGYQLRVQTLGAFRVWRGTEEIAAPEWRRENARQLFQVLLTRRSQLLDRDQITELLWPDQDPETMLRNFKVALSTLSKVLEPQHKANAPSAYITRDGTLYGLRPGADLWLDVAEFERLVSEGDRLLNRDPLAAQQRYQQALALYQGEYLQEYLYADWLTEERERLLALYLRTADRVAHALLAQHRWAEAIALGESILARDDCWEQAYQVLMRAYSQLGNRPQALRTYQRCVERLRDELGVSPSAATLQLYQSINE